MLRLVNDVPRWHCYLHRDARELPPVDKDDTPVRKLEDELFDVLYSGESEKAAKPDCRNAYQGMGLLAVYAAGWTLGRKEKRHG